MADVMPSSPEEAFRLVERRLDGLVETARPNLSMASIRDMSERSDHYKSHALTWYVEFVMDNVVDGEHHRVTAVLSYSEPLPTEVYQQIAIARRAEVFQTGQRSRIDVRQSHSLPIDELVARGVDGVVHEEFRCGLSDIANAI